MIPSNRVIASTTRGLVSRSTTRANNTLKTNFSSSPRLLSTMDASNDKKVLYDVVPKDDFGKYKEYSVIFTNRSLNLMSDPFQKVMRDLNVLLKTTYNASKVAIIPGYVYTSLTKTFPAKYIASLIFFKKDLERLEWKQSQDNLQQIVMSW